MTDRNTSVHFPLSLGAGDPALQRKSSKMRRSVRVAPSAAVNSEKGTAPEVGRPHPILILGTLGRDHLTVGDQLATLHYDESSYHGKLQVALSALKRMEAGVKALLEEAEHS